MTGNVRTEDQLTEKEKNVIKILLDNHAVEVATVLKEQLLKFEDSEELMQIFLDLVKNKVKRQLREEEQ